MRFLFCAAAVERLLPPSPVGSAGAAGGLRPGSSLDVDKLVEYIVRSQNYDGGIGLGPGMESHGGSTYCTHNRALSIQPTVARKGRARNGRAR